MDVLSTSFPVFIVLGYITLRKSLVGMPRGCLVKEGKCLEGTIILHVFFGQQIMLALLQSCLSGLSSFGSSLIKRITYTKITKFSEYIGIIWLFQDIFFSLTSNLRVRFFQTGSLNDLYFRNVQRKDISMSKSTKKQSYKHNLL